MPICPKCSKKSNQFGERCSCGRSYTVRDNPGSDPLGLLGKLLLDKFIPIAVLKSNQCSITYEAVQLVVDRIITLNVLKPASFADKEIRDCFHKVVEKYSVIKQQNIPTLLEVLDLKQEKTFAVTSDAPRGECLSDIIKNRKLEPVSLMHISHQALQALATIHQNGLRFPNFGMDNIYVMRSGGDDSFVKIVGFIEANLATAKVDASTRDDVYDIAQMILSLMTEKQQPINSIELPQDRLYLTPIAQLFLKAATGNQPYPSCMELLNAFEAAFNITPVRETKVSPLGSQEMPAVKSSPQKPTPVPFEQIIWMHQPPQRDD